MDKKAYHAHVAKYYLAFMQERDVEKLRRRIRILDNINARKLKCEPELF